MSFADDDVARVACIYETFGPPANYNIFGTPAMTLKYATRLTRRRRRVALSTFGYKLRPRRRSIILLVNRPVHTFVQVRPQLSTHDRMDVELRP